MREVRYKKRAQSRLNLTPAVADNAAMATTAGGFAASKIKERQWRYLRDFWWIPAGAFAALFLLGWLLFLVFPTVTVPMWLVCPASIGFALWAIRAELTGTANLVFGRDTERYTSDVLRKAVKGRGAVVDAIPLDFGDIDHVVVAEFGVIAVETKATECDLDLGDERSLPWVRSWVEQAKRSAWKTRCLLRSAGYVVEVTPLVVVSGIDVRGAPVCLDGVWIVKPKHVPGFLDGRDAYGPSTVSAMGTFLAREREKRVEFQRSKVGTFLDRRARTPSG